MSNAARKQVGQQSKKMRCRPKSQYLPTHDLSLHQAVMYQDPVSKSGILPKLQNSVMNQEVTLNPQKKVHNIEKHKHI